MRYRQRRLQPADFLLVCLLLIFSGVLPVQAETYYVATIGNDSNPGTITQPFRTIAKGISILRPSDKLLIRNGTYLENIDSNRQNIPAGTSWADAPLISGYPGETVSLGGGAINLVHSYIQYLVLANLILDGGYQGVSTGAGGNGPHHVKFQNLEIKNSIHNCVQIGVPSHHIWFTGGSVHDCGLTVTEEYPFYIGGDDHIIENLEIYNSNRYCIHIYDSNPPYPNRIIVRNNRIHNCGIKTPSDAAILLSKGDGNMAYNNVVYGNSSHGIVAAIGATNSKIYNNTVYGGKQTGIYVQSTAVSTEIKNNISYGNATTQILDQGAGTTVSNNLISNPSFVNAAAYDFSLQSNSPAVDAGAALLQVPTDIRMIPRPQGTSYDIGAYEGGGIAAAPAPPRNLMVR